MKAIYGVVVENGKRVRRTIILEPRKCLLCGIEFQPSKQSSKYCSSKCSKKHDYQLNAEKYNELSRIKYRNNLEEAREKRRKYYWSDPERFRNAVKKYRDEHKEKYKEYHDRVKDQKRHGGKRNELLNVNGPKCDMCGVVKKPKDIVAHHITGNNQEHEQQQLLCRKCHKRLHLMQYHPGRKNISKEQIVDAINSSKDLEEASSKLGIARCTLYQKRKEFGLPKLRGEGW